MWSLTKKKKKKRKEKENSIYTLLFQTLSYGHAARAMMSHFWRVAAEAAVI